MRQPRRSNVDQLRPRDHGIGEQGCLNVFATGSWGKWRRTGNLCASLVELATLASGEMAPIVRSRMSPDSRRARGGGRGRYLLELLLLLLLLSHR